MSEQVVVEDQSRAGLPLKITVLEAVRGGWSLHGHPHLDTPCFTPLELEDDPRPQHAAGHKISILDSRTWTHLKPGDARCCIVYVVASNKLRKPPTDEMLEAFKAALTGGPKPELIILEPRKHFEWWKQHPSVW